MGQAGKRKHVPTAERRIIERPRLLRRLEEANARTILLVAPAGYGKTTLAQQWASGRKASAWYTTTDGARDVVELARDLAETVTAALGSSGTHFSEFLQTIENPGGDARRIVRTLADAISCSGLKHLVIDDYQVIEGSGPSEAAVDLIRRIPGLQVLVTSRVRPAWGSARKVVYGEVFELTREDLAMTANESEELLGAESRAWIELAELARGWPAVLGLAALTPSAKPPDASLPSALYDFFAEELVGSAEPRLREALSTAALLPSLRPRLMRRAFGDDAESFRDEMFALGAVTHVQDGLELHPLLRDFLVSRLEQLPDAEDRIREAVSVALEVSAWDTAIKLIRRFDLAEMIEHVLVEAYRPLLTSGRIGTLSEFDDHVRALGRRRFPALDLIAAELALRRGEFASAEQTATRVARQMDTSHKLRSHAHSIAGQAAFSTWEARRAEGHFQRALSAAISDEDESEAVWGLALTAIYGDTGHLSAAVAALQRRADHSAVDMVRHTLAQLALARVGGGLKSVPDLEDALHVTRSIDDPRVRTSFYSSYSYYKGLQTHYTVAASIAQEALNDADAFQLASIAPHLHWNLSSGPTRASSVQRCRQVPSARRTVLRQHRGSVPCPQRSLPPSSVLAHTQPAAASTR